METPSDILLEAIDPIRTAPFEPGDLRRLEEIEAPLQAAIKILWEKGIPTHQCSANTEDINAGGAVWIEFKWNQLSYNNQVKLALLEPQPSMREEQHEKIAKVHFPVQKNHKLSDIEAVTTLFSHKLLSQKKQNRL